ncbi:MAG: acetolactate decarboxylase [Gammaproteobacteria bacterium]
MKEIRAIVLLLCGLGWASASLAAGSIYQIGMIKSLSAGVFEGTTTYAQLAKLGDFAVGTFNDLNGEMGANDGKFYRFQSDKEPYGKLIPVASTDISPFAQVVYFKPTKKMLISNIENFKNLNAAIEKQLPNKNIPYAIRIKGKFENAKLRSLSKQKAPYPKLSVAAKSAAYYSMDKAEGTLVGYWFPALLNNLGPEKSHFHLISQKANMGGHLLDVKVKDAVVEIQPIHDVKILLPNNKVFARTTIK